MKRVVAFPRKKERVIIANTFSSPVQAVTFRLDEQHVVVPFETPHFDDGQHVHLQLLCGEGVTTMHIYYVQQYFEAHFPEVSFVFCAQTSAAIFAGHVMASCVIQRKQS